MNWVGTAVGGGSADESTCVDGVNCDTFLVTLSGTPTNWAGLKARITISSADPSGLTDYDVYVHRGNNNGPIVPVGSSAHSGTPPETVDLDPSNPDIGTGQFSVHVVYFSAFAGFQYSGNAHVVSTSAGTALAPSAPQDRGPKIGFQNFEAPGNLVQVTDSSQGPTVQTVEYLGHDAGEPSIGVNWNSPNSANGATNFQSDLQTLFIRFDDSCPANGRSATWYNSPAPTSQFVDSDPIGFTDRQTGRVFAGELTLLSPTCKVSFTDTDGLDALGNTSYAGWSPSSGRSARALIMRRSAVAPITSPLRLTDRIRTPSITVRKIWSPRFIYAAMMAARLMVRRYPPTRRNAADCMGTSKSRRTEQFIFRTTAVVARVLYSFQKTTV